MEPIFTILLSVGSFLLGYFIQERIYKRMNLDDKCRKTIKKHKDIVNWLKSELSGTKKQKSLVTIASKITSEPEGSIVKIGKKYYRVKELG